MVLRGFLTCPRFLNTFCPPIFKLFDVRHFLNIFTCLNEWRTCLKIRRTCLKIWRTCLKIWRTCLKKWRTCLKNADNFWMSGFWYFALEHEISQNKHVCWHDFWALSMYWPHRLRRIFCLHNAGEDFTAVLDFNLCFKI